MAQLTVAPDAARLAAIAAERITARIEAAIAARGTATVCLTGGSTPAPVYGLLADREQPWRERIDWAHLFLFWGDERCVPPDHPDSNFGMANERMVSRVPIPASHVFRMHGEYPDAREAAAEYESALAGGFRRAQRTDGAFDVLLLGIGEDAHIASIFPGSPLLRTGPTAGEFARSDASDHVASRVAAVWAPHLDAWRITLTPMALLAAHRILVLAAGDEKAAAIAAALEAPEDVERYPAQLLRRGGDVVEWLIDEDAASLLARK